MQYELPYIQHAYAGAIIQQRVTDGYINATAMCRAAGETWDHYYSNKTTKAFLDKLSEKTGIPVIQENQGLVQSRQGIGTWVHPKIALHLAQWLSADFAVQVADWVYDWMSGKGSPGKHRLPFHLRRYVANQQNVPAGHFSVLTEMTQLLIAPLEAMGYELPEKLWPDISEGKMFCAWLRDQCGVDTNALPTYMHVFEDGRPPVRAKAYPNGFLAAFREHFTEVWLPQRSVEYFTKRDLKALPLLPKLLPPPKAA